ncbi:Regulatory-associated protein of mTOR [Fasciola gigantica]|uniref:Regulatory-associated protein of mTOR n=1 Tax=Fasciola gigantica TaxID=46835 RepID=A0A504Y8T4_FASGI|nr:Regulatory-associated protein of mTOR [Fasciola gigantica]
MQQPSGAVQFSTRDSTIVRPAGFPQVPARPISTTTVPCERTRQPSASGVSTATGLAPPGFRSRSRVPMDSDGHCATEDSGTRRMVKPRTTGCEPIIQNQQYEKQRKMLREPSDSTVQRQSKLKTATTQSTDVAELTETSDDSLPPTIVVPTASERSSLPNESKYTGNTVPSPIQPGESNTTAKPSGKVTFSDCESEEEETDEDDDDEDDDDDDDDVEIDESDSDDGEDSGEVPATQNASQTVRTTGSLELLVRDKQLNDTVPHRIDEAKVDEQSRPLTQPQEKHQQREQEQQRKRQPKDFRYSFIKSRWPKRFRSCPNLAISTICGKPGTRRVRGGHLAPSAIPYKGEKTENKCLVKRIEDVTKPEPKTNVSGIVSKTKEADMPHTSDTVERTTEQLQTDESKSKKSVQRTALLRRQRHGVEQLYILQGQAATPMSVAPINPKSETVTGGVPATERPTCPPRPQIKTEQQSKQQQSQIQLQPQRIQQPPVTLKPGWTAVQDRVAVITVAQVAALPTVITTTTTVSTTTSSAQSTQPVVQSQPQPPVQQSNNKAPNATGPPVPSVSAGSVIGGSGPASFFTSQMTAFKVWLQTADEKQPPATQLPILLQILLSQSHRIRAMQLLGEFLDLGPWAVTHCLTVGILPYIVRLFHSPVAEVKPHLVFIWGKIIATAQTEFGRNDSVRDFGYKYFITCLNDTENLLPLTRTITAFALAKMLEKEPHGESDTFFQDVYLKQNFIPLVLSQLDENPPNLAVEIYVRLRLWLIFALAKVWRNNDEARWFGVRYNVTEILFTYLDDISPEVRAATVYALGTLIANQTADSSKQDHADQVSHQVGARLVRVAYVDASWLVRSELVVAFAGLARQFEVQLCAMALCNMQEFGGPSSTTPPVNASLTPVLPPGRQPRHSISGGSYSSILWHMHIRNQLTGSSSFERLVV